MKDDQPDSGGSPPPLWLCLHLPQLPVEIFTRGMATPARPVIVVSQQKVAAMNAAASELGIRHDSSVATAHTVADGLVTLERNQDRELATLQRLAAWAYQFTPAVAVHAPDCLLLDISGCLKLFSGITTLRQLIKGGIAAQGFSAAIGINATPQAALCTAMAGLPDNTSGTVGHSLATLDTGWLRVDQRIIDDLGKTGIASTGQLLSLPSDGLRRRFGVYFSDYLQRLTGARPDPQKLISETPQFNSDMTFIPDVTNLQSLLFPIKRLLAELSEFLKVRQLHVNRLTFTLDHRFHEPKSFSVHLASPDNDTAMFLMLTQLQLDKVTDVPELDNLSLTTGPLYPASAASEDLFQGSGFRQKQGVQNSRAVRDNALRLVNQLRNRLGRRACFGLSEANDHRPEKAWQAVSLAQRHDWQDSSHSLLPRPTLLLATPQPLLADAGVPCLQGRLTLLRGPERIDCAWWDQDSEPRDYFICRHETGALYWVYRTHRCDEPGAVSDSERSWYLHGIFA